jgi:hypothetical protein
MPAATADILPEVTPPERRSARRLVPGSLTPCLLHIPGEVGPASAWVHNVSVCGVGILSNRFIAIGTTIRAVLINAAHTFAIAVEADVVRTYPIYNGDHLLGCQFREVLRYDQIVPLLL